MIADAAATIAEVLGSLEQPHACDWSALLTRLAMSIPEQPSAPPSTVTSLATLLTHPTFLELQDSWQLAYFLLSHWDWLEPPQRELLRQPIAQSFTRFANPMGAFVVGELLGEKYADGAALAALLELSDAGAGAVRGYLPHGLESLARHTGDPTLRGRAVEALKALAREPDPEVCGEATLSLEKVARATAG